MNDVTLRRLDVLRAVAVVDVLLVAPVIAADAEDLTIRRRLG